MLQAAAIETLAALTQKLAVAKGPWWLIGGAAVALHGADIGVLADIDVILGAEDARLVLDVMGAPPNTDGGSDRLRSRVFGCWRDAPVAVDVMGDFEVRTSRGWTSIRPATRAPFAVGGATLYAPSRDELIGILRLIGRPKDFARAELLAL